MLSIEQLYRHCEWWDEVNWSQTERDVRRLQSRIYSASKKGDFKRVNNLMKLLARSEKAKTVSKRSAPYPSAREDRTIPRQINRIPT